LPKPRVAVAMSGGVDSSLACLLLVEQGFDVVGLTMKLVAAPPSQDDPVAKPCCTLEMTRDAQRICCELGIPHYTVNLVEAFEEEVIARFVEDYSRGRTPNPCLVCNSKFKFGHLLHKAQQLGAEYLATGHYVRAGEILKQRGFIDNHILARGSGDQYGREEAKARILLARGTDRGKDQSYALYGLTQDMLKHALFPLGNFTKQHVREIAAQKGIITAEKPESQEICFVTQGSYRTFLEERNVKMLPGLFADTSGKVLGHHKGLAFYTVGQRKGLGISSPYPLYVVGIDAGENVVIVGKRNEAYSEGCYIEDLNFVMVDHLDSPVEGTCMVRYRGKEVPATLIPLKNDLLHRGPGQVASHEQEGLASSEEAGRVLVKFDQPQFAVTPGQALVFYRGEFVYGGGTIVKKT
jgi:tRNA-specific 2-thiouridylase